MAIKPDMNDPETVKQFNRFLGEQKRRKKMNVLSSKEKKEIQELEHQALNLWRQVVRKRANKECAVPTCNKVKFLNSHHIESYTTNKTLRYDPMNGICLCPTHHKFGWLSAHKSFCFMYSLLRSWYPERLEYLRDHYQNKTVITKEFLESKIEDLSRELEGRVKRERGKPATILGLPVVEVGDLRSLSSGDIVLGESLIPPEKKVR